MKDLVVYFSLEGNTQYVAEKIKEQIGADLLRLIPKKAYHEKGFAKYFWGGKSAVMAEKPELEDIVIDLDSYDRIIFGFPVWASNYAPPLRTFIQKNRFYLRDKEFVAFACQSGSGAEKAFSKLAVSLGIDKFELTEIFLDPKEKNDSNVEAQIVEFCRQLKAEERDLLSEEKLKSIVDEIENAERPPEIRYSIDVNGIVADIEEESMDPSFHELLFKLISEKNLSNVEFYKRAWIDRKLFSAIKNNRYYKPSKETAVACCLGLQLTLDEATELLDAAGYSLSKSKNFDRVIRYCLLHQIYKIEQVNQILYEFEETCLGV